jgi:transcriptional regulator with XRE-family HTH domain
MYQIMEILLDDRKIAENIRFYLKINGLKAFDVAEKLGMTESAYTRYERGEGELTIRLLRKIADTLCVNPFLLLSVSVKDCFKPGYDNKVPIPDISFLTTNVDQTRMILSLIKKVDIICDATLKIIEKEK